MSTSIRRPQVCILGSAELGSAAYELAGEAGELLAKLGLTVVSGCGSPATRFAAERAIQAGGLVVSIVPPDQMPSADWPATVVICLLSLATLAARRAGGSLLAAIALHTAYNAMFVLAVFSQS